MLITLRGCGREGLDREGGISIMGDKNALYVWIRADVLKTDVAIGIGSCIADT